MTRDTKQLIVFFAVVATILIVMAIFGAKFTESYGY